MEDLGRLRLVGAGGEPVELRRTLTSHGVAMLAPQRIDPERRVLETTVALPGGGACTVVVRPSGRGSVRVGAGHPPAEAAARRQLLATARHVLRLDEDLSPFYDLVAEDPALGWAVTGAGRMLRSPTVFEDVVKTVCTTNCSWSATVRMTDALVGHLGAAAPGGRRAFPSPPAMAEAGPGFYRDVARAGYRGAYLLALARKVADGHLDLEALADPSLPDDEVERRLLDLPGVGPYAAAHVMLISLGRYRRLILDSWTRPTFARLHGRPATDRVIERRFRPYGRYAGLAFWLYLTRDWVDDAPG